MSDKVIVVVGAGRGVSASVARRFAAEGYAVGLLGRNRAVLSSLANELIASGVRVESTPVDLADPAALTPALRALGERFGRIGVLHFNPSAYREQDPLTLSVAGLLADVALGIGALLTSVQAARPFLTRGSRITVTGSMAADRPWHGAASLGVQKAGVRNLVQSLDATLAPDGIRAVSVTVRGVLAAEGPFSPDGVAEAIHAASAQDESSWRSEIPYDG